MARISNKQVYKIVDPTASDYVIGTDAEDLNKTKTFTMQGIADFVGGNVTVGVGSLNGLVGAVTLSAGVGLVLTEDGNDLTLSLSTPDFVESVNGLDGVITVQGSTNIGVTDDGTDTITLTALNLAKTNEANTFTNDQTLNRSLSVAGGVFDVDFDTQRVGVNNPTPLYPLDIVGDTSITGTTGDVLTLNSPSEVGENYILFNNSLGTDKGWVGYRGASDVLQLRSLLGSVNIIADTSVTLSYGGVTRLETTGSGVQITGDLTVGDVTASSIVITGGTSSDFLKADGSLDGTTYQDVTERGQADGYVPLNSLSKIENTFLPNDLERTTNKGAANGYAPLDSGAKIPLVNIPDSVLGQVTYEGTWDANNNLPLLTNPPAADTKGEYYVCSSSGTQFGLTFQTGDWIISNGTAWEKVDNTDAVTSVFGRLGNVVANAGDYDAFYVTLDTAQTITGEKTFSGDSLLIANAGNGLKGRFKNTSIGSVQDSGYATLGFNGSNNLFFTKGINANFNGGIFAWDNNDAIRTYTLQDASGTLAFTSDLDDYVTLDTTQTISASKTFTNTGSANTVVINHTSGSAGIALDITKSANGEGLKVNKTSGTGNAATIIGTLEATDLVGGSATITGNLAVDTDTLFVDASNNRVGIGTTSPSEALSINGKISINDGGNSVFVGEGAGLNDDGSGNGNVGVGYEALKQNTTGLGNTANGYIALLNNTTGGANTANGSLALRDNTTGSLNTANGYQALLSNTTGSSNTANGYYAFRDNTTGSFNTASGHEAGSLISDGGSNQTCNNSVFVGYSTRALNNGETNQIVIGSEAVGNGSNSVTLGNDSIVKTILKGDIGIGESDPDHKLHVVSNEQCPALFESTIAGGGIALMDSTTTNDEQVGIGAFGNNLCFRAGGDADGNMRLHSTGNLTIGGNLSDSGNILDVRGNATINGTLDVTGVITGNGSGLTNVDADTLGGILASNYARTDIAETFNDTVYFDRLAAINTSTAVDISGNYGTLTVNGNFGGFTVYTENDVEKGRVGTVFDTLHLSADTDITIRAGGFGSSSEVINITASQATFEVDTVVKGDLTVDTDTLFVDSSNNRLGIGTSSPSAKLQLKMANDSILSFDELGSINSVIRCSGSIAFDSDYNFIFRDEDGTNERMRIDSSGDVSIGDAASFGRLRVGHTGDDAEAIVIGDGSTPSNDTGIYLRTVGLGVISVGSTGSLSFRRGGGAGTESMRIDSSGNVGVGEQNPDKKLHIKDASEPYLRLENTDTSLGTDQLIGGFDVYSNDASAAGTGIAGAINLYSESSFGEWTYMTFSTRRGNSGTALERMRIDSLGNVGIGTSSPVNPVGFNKVLNVSGPDSALVISNTSGTAKNWTIGALDSGTLYIADGSAGRMTIDSSGNVSMTGNLSVTGSLSKGSGSFKIDHPLPEKKDTHHLVHSFVEAPQADNIYRGKVELSEGKATVNLDEAGRMTEGTFVLLNGNIQCFTSNESGWTAIRGKVEGNILTIEAQDAECTDTVSWIVIGERIDQHMIDTEWTDENGRVITEPLKKVEPTPENNEEEEATIIDNGQ